MKTLQDCKERVARPYKTTFSIVVHTFRGTDLPYRLLHQAAELYGRYMRFVGRAQARGEIEDIVFWHLKDNDFRDVTHYL